MDAPGNPVSYLALSPRTPVYAEGGVAVGRVREVLVEDEVDVFDGIILRTEHGDRFVDRDQIGSMYEQAVLLDLTAEECMTLPTPSEARHGVGRGGHPHRGGGPATARPVGGARGIWGRLRRPR